MISYLVEDWDLGDQKKTKMILTEKLNCRNYLLKTVNLFINKNKFFYNWRWSVGFM